MLTNVKNSDTVQKDLLFVLSSFNVQVALKLKLRKEKIVMSR